jgi:hypothetical protein
MPMTETSPSAVAAIKVLSKEEMNGGGRSSVLMKKLGFVRGASAAKKPPALQDVDPRSRSPLRAASPERMTRTRRRHFESCGRPKSSVSPSC